MKRDLNLQVEFHAPLESKWMNSSNHVNIQDAAEKQSCGLLLQVGFAGNTKAAGRRYSDMCFLTHLPFTDRQNEQRVVVFEMGQS